MQKSTDQKRRDPTIALGAALALLAVVAGAYGAHGARAEGANLVALASRYQMWHALAIILCSAVLAGNRIVPAMFTAGIVLFCGSLYLLALGLGGAIGWLTPIGGLFFLAGWATLAILCLRR